MTPKIVEIKQTKHEVRLKHDLQSLLDYEPFWNVMMVCSDGTIGHNRLAVGLVFPQLQDQGIVICPDHSIQDITDLINKTLYFGHKKKRLKPTPSIDERVITAEQSDTALNVASKNLEAPPSKKQKHDCLSSEDSNLTAEAQSQPPKTKEQQETILEIPISTSNIQEQQISNLETPRKSARKQDQQTLQRKTNIVKIQEQTKNVESEDISTDRNDVCTDETPKVKRSDVKLKKMKMTKQHWQDINEMRCSKVCEVEISRLQINSINVKHSKKARKNLPDIRKHFPSITKEKKSHKKKPIFVAKKKNLKQSSFSKKPAGKQMKKRWRCLKCKLCLQPDCRKCKYCKDMRRYGGPGVKKQACENRPKCKALQATKSVPQKPSTKMPQPKVSNVRDKNKTRFIARVNIRKRDVVITKSYTKLLMETKEYKKKILKKSDPRKLNELLSETVADWTEPENLFEELANCTVVMSNNKCIMIPSPAKTIVSSIGDETTKTITSGSRTFTSAEPINSQDEPDITLTAANIKERYGIKLSPNSLKRLSCEGCEFVGKSPSGLKRHRSRYHSSDSDEKEPEQNSTLAQTTEQINNLTIDQPNDATNQPNEEKGRPNKATDQPNDVLNCSNEMEVNDQTNGSLQGMNDNYNLYANESVILVEASKSSQDILNNTTQSVNISFSDMTNIMESKKTAVVSPLKPEESNASKALHCEDCNFVGKTTPGLKRHKTTAHKLSLKNKKRAKTEKMNIQKDTGNETETENILDTGIAGESAMDENEQETESSSRDSSLDSYSVALPADYLKYIYL